MRDALKFLPVTDAGPEIKLSIASGVFELDEGFYSLLFSGRNTALGSIVHALNEPGGDLGCGLVAYNNNHAVGYLSFFAVEQKTTRNLATLKSCLDLSSSDNRQKLRLASMFQQQLAPIESTGFYLNKIFVLPNYQGLSYGFQLFSHFLFEADRLNLPAVFHVKRDNYAAIKFYQRQGFEVKNSEHEYVVCKKR